MESHPGTTFRHYFRVGAIYWHPLPLLLASVLLLAGLVQYVLLFLPQDIPDEASDRRPIFPALEQNANDVRRYLPQGRLQVVALLRPPFTPKKRCGGRRLWDPHSMSTAGPSPSPFYGGTSGRARVPSAFV